MSKVVDGKMANSKVILCDIEGTTTAISYVKDTLFPYAEKHVETFLAANWQDEDVQTIVTELRAQYNKDVEAKVEGCVEIVDGTVDTEKEKQITSIVDNVKWQMSIDRKTTALKSLQGLIWAGGYKTKSLKAHVYDDVAPALDAWTKSGHKIFIYSSGSAEIQKIHFAYSESGDLAGHLSGFYDTKVGAKQEKSSYEAILKEIIKESGDEELKANDVLFLTDVAGEGVAAEEAGMNVILLKRPGNAELTSEDQKRFTVVDSFADIVLEDLTAITAAAATKRKVVEAEPEEADSPPAKLAKMEEPVVVPVTKAVEVIETKSASLEEKQEDNKADSKETDKSDDVPMETETVVKVNEDETTDKKKTEENIEQPKAEEKMEVDSATVEEKKTEILAESAKPEIVAEPAKPTTEVEATEKSETVEKVPVKDTITETKEVDNSKPTATENLKEEKTKPNETEKQVEIEEKKPAEEAPKIEAEEPKEESKTNGEAKENGQAAAEGTNGTENGTTVNGNESDKENEKTVENEPLEEPAIAEVPAADVIVKKCTTTETPIVPQAPAEVETES